MGSVRLEADGIEAEVDSAGGRLTRLRWFSGGRLIAMLAEAPPEAAPRSAFAMVPFGNRMRGNGFRFGGRDHRVAANTPGDPLALHGDGWLGAWDVLAADMRSVRLRFRQGASDATPYRYEARQDWRIEEGTLVLSLSVRNKGLEALPFGLGWHPCFPLTPETTLEAGVWGLWSEGPDHLPADPVPLPPDLDFASPLRPPRRWVNNAFGGWDGTARIAWPEMGAALAIAADAPFRHAFLFVPDRAFDPSYVADWFCFEPMTHRAGGHDRPDLGGLAVLRPGEALSGALQLRPERLT